MTVEGKVVAITGVSSGLGTALSKRFAGRGALVVGCARRAEAGASLENEIRSGDAEFAFVRADLSRPDQCVMFVDEVIGRHGRIDVLINNAGGHVRGGIAPVETLAIEAWNATMDINLRSAFLCSRAAMRSMGDSGGAILNISSVQAVQAVAWMTAYNVAKAGVVQLSRSLAVEGAPRGIRVNALLVGGLITEHASDVRQWLRQVPPVVTSAPVPPNRPPHLRSMDCDEAADAVIALAGDDARGITGATIAIDRGRTAGALTSHLVHESARGEL